MTQKPLYQIDAERKAASRRAGDIASGKVAPNGTLFRTCPHCQLGFLLSPFLSEKFPQQTEEEKTQICHQPEFWLRNYWAQIDAKYPRPATESGAQEHNGEITTDPPPAG